MKKYKLKQLFFFVFLLGSFVCTYQAQAQLFDMLKQESKKLLLNDGSSSLPFSQDEAVKALKQALTKGIQKGTNIVSKQDGFFKNPEIIIPFPQDAKKVESTLRKMGLGSEIDKVVLSLNRAAEDASISALQIFINAITSMTISDAISIVKGDKTAATQFLRKTTYNQLLSTFTPTIKNSLDKVDATKYWSSIMNTYNKIPFIQKVNPDLTAYVTEKALNGLFIMIAKEEEQIRKDPIAQTTELLKKVFGKRN
jgi:Protein of unknown function (DUF4197)